MSNPNGPYPGRQLFIGLTAGGNPCLAYLVTGRSLPTRERRAMLMGTRVAIGPIGTIEYDPLRHYTAVACDPTTGIAVVSNGIQTEAIFETYRLLFHTGSLPTIEYMERLLDGAGAEPDSYHTPRIAGVLTSHAEAGLVGIIGIKCLGSPAKAFRVKMEPGVLTGVSTYRGALDNPEPFDINSGLPELKLEGATAGDIAGYLFDISSAAYKGQDIRVCSVGGIRADNGHTWSLETKNIH